MGCSVAWTSQLPGLEMAAGLAVACRSGSLRMRGAVLRLGVAWQGFHRPDAGLAAAAWCCAAPPPCGAARSCSTTTRTAPLPPPLHRTGRPGAQLLARSCYLNRAVDVLPQISRTSCRPRATHLVGACFSLRHQGAAAGRLPVLRGRHPAGQCCRPPTLTPAGGRCCRRGAGETPPAPHSLPSK